MKLSGANARSILCLCVISLAVAGCRDDRSTAELVRLFEFEELNLDINSSAQHVIRNLKQWQSMQPRVQYYFHRSVSNPQSLALSLKERGWNVRNNPVLDVKRKVDWGSNPNSDSNWLFQKNAFYGIAPFIQSHAESGDSDWLEIPTKMVLDWIEFNIEQNLPNEMKWDDMATGLRAVKLAYLIDAHLRIETSDAQPLERMIRAAVVHAQELSDPKKLAAGNHAYFQLVGLAAVCKALPLLRRCAEDRAYIEETFERVIAGQFNVEGMHREHSPDYHFFSLSRLDAILNTGWFELSAESQARVDRARGNVSFLLHPDGSRVMFGDTERRAQGKQQNWFQTDYSGHVFHEAGYAMFKGGGMNDAVGPWSLAFWAGDERTGEKVEHGYGHSHSDNFTFEWFDKGRLILTDAGKYSYDMNKWRDYFTSTRAHNTVEIDGRDFRNRTLDGINPGIVDAQGSSVLPYIHALVRHEKLDVRHRRLLVFEPNAWLVVVDLLTGEEEHDYTQWFHLQEDWEVVDHGKFFIAEIEEEKLLIQSLSAGEVVSSMVRGVEAPRLQGWVSPAYKVILPNAALGFSNRGKTSNLVTLFRHGPIEGKLVVEDLMLDGPEIEVCWQVKGSIEGFRLALGDAPVRCE